VQGPREAAFFPEANIRVLQHEAMAFYFDLFTFALIVFGLSRRKYLFRFDD
jgi:hypothetical protein